MGEAMATAVQMMGQNPPVKAQVVYYSGRFLGPRPLTLAQVRALHLAAQEGSLDNHNRRWAPPGQLRGLGPEDQVQKPYEQGGTVMALQSRGLLAPDPTVPQGSSPRPRLMTELGKQFLATQNRQE